MHLRQRDLTPKNGQVARSSQSESIGLGIRLLSNGAWGFASTDRLTREGVAACGGPSRFHSEASALAKRSEVVLAPEKAYVDSWQRPLPQRSLRNPLETQLALLLAADAEMRRVKGVTLDRNGHAIPQDRFPGSRQHWLAHSPAQSDLWCGICRHFVSGEEKFKTFLSQCFLGPACSPGLRTRDSLDLMRTSNRRRRSRRAAFRIAMPGEVGTLILGASQLGLQIHESIGHPIELDRVLGQEANFRRHKLF